MTKPSHLTAFRVGLAAGCILFLLAGCGSDDPVVDAPAATPDAAPKKPAGKTGSDGAATAADVTCTGDDVDLQAAAGVISNSSLDDPAGFADLASLLSTRESSRLLKGRIMSVEAVNAEVEGRLKELQAETGVTLVWSGVRLVLDSDGEEVAIGVPLAEGSTETIAAAGPTDEEIETLRRLRGACAVGVSGTGTASTLDAPVVMAVAGRSGRPVALVPGMGNLVVGSATLDDLGQKIADAVR